MPQDTPTAPSRPSPAASRRVEIPLHLQTVFGPIHVEIGTTIFDESKGERAAYRYPKQSFELDTAVLEANGLNPIHIKRLVEGYWIIYRSPEVEPGYSILEFPDGSRYVHDTEYLGNHRVADIIVRRLPNAPR